MEIGLPASHSDQTLRPLDSPVEPLPTSASTSSIGSATLKKPSKAVPRRHSTALSAAEIFHSGSGNTIRPSSGSLSRTEDTTTTPSSGGGTAKSTWRKSMGAIGAIEKRENRKSLNVNLMAVTPVDPIIDTPFSSLECDQKEEERKRKERLKAEKEEEKRKKKEEEKKKKEDEKKKKEDEKKKKEDEKKGKRLSKGPEDSSKDAVEASSKAEKLKKEEEKKKKKEEAKKKKEEEKEKKKQEKLASKDKKKTLRGHDGSAPTTPVSSSTDDMTPPTPSSLPPPLSDSPPHSSHHLVDTSTGMLPPPINLTLRELRTQSDPSASPGSPQLSVEELLAKTEELVGVSMDGLPMTPPAFNGN